MGRVVIGLVGALLVAITVTAQRAACTGRFVDRSGEPIANSTVTFVEEAARTFGLDQDRLEVHTGDDGRFTADLRLGSPYDVWALGPTDGKGVRWLTELVQGVAAGQELELRALRRAGRFSVELRGVEAWRQYVPPALRVLVGGRHVFGIDRPLPRGAKSVEIGPVPDHELVLALVDDKRQVLCSSEPVARSAANGAPMVAEFPEPRPLECEVVDESGEAMGDVELMVRTVTRWTAAMSRLMPGPFMGGFDRSVRTRSDGRVQVVVPSTTGPWSGSALIAARSPGFATSLGGFVNDQPFEHFAPAEGRERLTFTMIERPGLELSLADGVGDRAYVLLNTWMHATFDNGGLVGRFAEPVRPASGVASGATMANSNGADVHLTLAPRGSEWPPLVCHASSVASDTTIDLGNLKAHRVRVVRQRGGVEPFARVGVGCQATTYPKPFYPPGITDEEGTVTLLVESRRAFVFAVGDAGFGVVELAEVEPDAEVVIELRDWPVAELVVTNAAGQPVAGARMMRDARPRVDARRNDHPVRRRVAQLLLWGARSDAAGRLRVPLLSGDVSDARIGLGARRSEPLVLTAGDSPRSVVIE